MKKVLDTEDGIMCDSVCQSWFHVKCIGMTRTDYSMFSKDNNKKWNCLRVDCNLSLGNPSNQIIHKMDEILSKFSQLATKEELSYISNGIHEIKADLNKLNDKINSFEPRLDNLEGELFNLKAERSQLENNNNPPEKIIEEISDRQRRSNNVMIYGVKERNSSQTDAVKNHDSKFIEQILKSSGVQCTLDDVRFFRVGKKFNDKPRAIKLCLPSASDAVSIFRYFATRDGMDDTLRDLSVGRDRTLMERQYLSNLRNTLQSRTEAGEDNLTIKFVNNIPKIVEKKN